MLQRKFSSVKGRSGMLRSWYWFESKSDTHGWTSWLMPSTVLSFKSPPNPVPTEVSHLTLLRTTTLPLCDFLSKDQPMLPHSFCFIFSPNRCACISQIMLGLRRSCRTYPAYTNRSWKSVCGSGVCQYWIRGTKLYDTVREILWSWEYHSPSLFVGSSSVDQLIHGSLKIGSSWKQIVFTLNIHRFLFSCLCPINTTLEWSIT